MHKLLLTLLIISLGGTGTGGLFTYYTITDMCNLSTETSCTNLYAGALLALIFGIMALVVTSINAWLIYQAQTQRDDERDKKQDERLGRIERKIDKILREGVDKEG